MTMWATMARIVITVATWMVECTTAVHLTINVVPERGYLLE
jgi:hypothetical protein